MNDNFFTNMLSEGGKISHKRWISVSIAAVLAWAICYAITHAPTAPDRKNVIDATMLFVCVMSGVATIAQIVSLVKGTPAPKDEVVEPKNEPTITTEVSVTKTTTE